MIYKYDLLYLLFKIFGGIKMKMNLKRSFAICLIFCTLLTLASCARGGVPSGPAASAAPGVSATPAVQKVIWRVGHNNADDHYWNIYLTKFADLVAEKTDGQIEVQVYPNSQMGDDNALGEMIRNGNIEMMITGGCIPGKWYRPMMMVEMAGLFDNPEHVARCINPESGTLQAHGGGLRRGKHHAVDLLGESWL
jgi:TRAP-type C4-dicarboxylate transport system substrate-binding protein